MPCAAGDRCNMTLGEFRGQADSQHKCPKCKRHIHTLCGVPTTDPEHTRSICFCQICLTLPVQVIRIRTESDEESEVGEGGRAGGGRAVSGTAPVQIK